MNRPLALGLLAFAAISCREPADARTHRRRAPSADGLVTGFSTEGAAHVATVYGFNDPESVLHDPEQDVYFVSNVAGFGSLKDGNGYISRIRAGDAAQVDVFISGGQPGVTLDAPKGMTLQGDTLWVTDIDVVRGFHRRTGAPLATIDFAARAPSMLNDIAAGPDGALRVTDTGIHMVFEGNVPTGTDRIFEVRGRAIATIDSGAHLQLPNGVTFDSSAGRWVVVAFDRFAGTVAAMPPAADTSRRVLRRGSGQLDGVEPLGDGALLFSSWADSSVHVLRGGRDVRLVRELPEPADIGLDRRRKRVLVPLTVAGQVQIWTLP